MAWAAAREIRDREVVFVGIGLPNVAVTLAQRTHAPSIKMVYEAGVYGASPSRLPLSIGDPCLVSGAIQAVSMADVFYYYLQGGRIDVGFLGAAQIDRFGNLNTTVIGADYRRPKVRLPGSGGAAEISLLARKSVVIMAQAKNKFPEKVDFVTSVGFLEGGDARARLGAPGGGPERVITDLGVYGFDRVSHEMVLEKLHPGVGLEEVREKVGWPIRVADALDTTEPPGEREILLIRNELDPKGIYLQ
jgi:glutaconate CoA-transferase subunit B